MKGNRVSDPAAYRWPSCAANLGSVCTRASPRTRLGSPSAPRLPIPPLLTGDCWTKRSPKTRWPTSVFYLQQQHAWGRDDSAPWWKPTRNASPAPASHIGHAMPHQPASEPDLVFFQRFSSSCHYNNQNAAKSVGAFSKPSNSGSINVTLTPASSSIDSEVLKDPPHFKSSNFGGNATSSLIPD